MSYTVLPHKHTKNNQGTLF